MQHPHPSERILGGGESQQVKVQKDKIQMNLNRTRHQQFLPMIAQNNKMPMNGSFQLHHQHSQASNRFETETMKKMMRIIITATTNTNDTHLKSM